jgi:hypothetical protein
VPTEPGAPADTSDNKSDGANLEEKETTERKSNNIDDELQAEAGEKNSSPPMLKLLTIPRTSRSHLTPMNLYLHRWKKLYPTLPVLTPIKTTGSKAMSFQL